MLSYLKRSIMFGKPNLYTWVHLGKIEILFCSLQCVCLLQEQKKRLRSGRFVCRQLQFLLGSMCATEISAFRGKYIYTNVP